MHLEFEHNLIFNLVLEKYKVTLDSLLKFVPHELVNITRHGILVLVNLTRHQNHICLS